MPMSMSSQGGPRDQPGRMACPGDELDDYVRAFEQAYIRCGGADPAAYLPPREHPLHAEVLRELVRVDMEYRWERGLPKPLDEYQRSFPALADDREGLREIAFEEFRLRYQAGQNPSPEEYIERYGVELDLRSGRFRSLRRPGASVRRDDPEPPGSVRPSGAWTASRRIGDDGASARKLPEIGTDFLGFRLIQELGRGSFGRVFLARQEEMADRAVVLKISNDDQDESQTLAQLQHRNIVPIYSRHRDGRLAAVCMPYLGTVTLRDLFEDLKTQGALPDSGKDLLNSLSKTSVRKGAKAKSSEPSWTATIRAPESFKASQVVGVGPGVPAEAPGAAAAVAKGPRGVQDGPRPEAGEVIDFRALLGRYSYVDAILWMAARLADGLAHAHDRGILHRDVKPANVLLTDDGRPMLLDFNLAEDLKRHPARGDQHAALGGTLPYMPPEHLEGFRGGLRPVDARSDVYSLGVILFEMLTGRPPFPLREGSRDVTLAAMIADRQGPPPRLRPWNPGVSPAVESIVRHCLEADPDQRYPSARALLEDLERHLSHQPLKHAPDPSSRERTSKWLKRRHWLVTLGLAGALVATVVGGLGLALAVQQDRNARYEAANTFAAFNEKAEDALDGLYTELREPNPRKDAMAVARPALAAIGFSEGDAATRWWEDPPVSRFPAEQRARVREKVGDLLLAVVWTEARENHYRAALGHCDIAENAYGEGHAPQALWDERADLHLKLREAEAAKRSAERAKATPTTTAHDFFLSGAGLVYREEIAKALPILKRAARLEPANFWAMFHAGYAHFRAGHFPEAEAYFTACISLRPDYWVNWFRRAVTLEKRGELKAAEDDLDTGLKLKPDDARALYERGVLANRMGRNPEAVAWLDRAVATGKPLSRTFLARGQIKNLLGDTDGGARDIAKGFELPPADEMDWVARGVAHMRMNKNREAIDDFDEALKINPRVEFALLNKAMILSERLGLTVEAIAVLDLMIDVVPEGAKVWAFRGVLKARLGRDDAARDDAESALARNPAPEVRYQAACTYALTGRQRPADRREALLLLRDAFQNGFGVDRVDGDPDLGSLRDDPDFLRIVERAKAAKAAALSLTRTIPPDSNLGQVSPRH